MSIRDPRIRLLALAAVALTACEGSPDDAAGENAVADVEDAGAVSETAAASRAGDVEVVGTISATVDGEARTWYAISGTMEGEASSTALWTRLDEDSEERSVIIAAFDTREPPLETFRRDPAGAGFSYGEYEGSLLNIGFTFQPGDERLSLDAADATVVFLPDASEMNTSGMYALREGSLEVQRIEAGGTGNARFEGTFQGTLQQLAGSETMTVTDGRFDIAEARHFEVPEDEEP